MSFDLDLLEDAALVALHLRGPLAGRQAAFAALMRRHKQPLYRLIVAQIGDPDDALDLLQESFVSAHAALGRFDASRSLRAWLARIAINKSRDWHRRRRVRRFLTRVLPIEAGDQIADAAADTEAQAIDRDDLARTLAGIARLPASLRDPLLLCAVDELSQAEAAEALGITAKAVETRVRRARAALAADAVARP
ncbi:RNA polymerase sigma factor [Sphingomonas sp. Leaf38]|uniref:RNA polymerase sigma factor n=1 Tax=Sphingomonas sp. Leaf38 TaxID=1736217 RepID=UPI0006F486B8|nr:RNA polymerase sigma factor [Sphingomonas sp. Leaf38]KQN28684.1 RNA polymerase subunit sigma-24 [Sphingomonas sp. Leaf38]